MNFVIMCLPAIIETIFMYYLYNHLINRSKVSYIDFIFGATKVIIVGGILTSSVPIVIFSLVIDILYIFVINKKELINAFINYAISMILLMALQLLVVVITSIIGLSGMDIKMQIFCNILTLILIFILCKIFNTHKLYKFVLSSKLPVKLLLINSALTIYAILFIFKDNHNSVYTNIPLYLSVFSIILAVNMCALYYEKSLSVKQKELQAYQKNMPIYETLIEEIRSNQHEYTNRVQSLQNLSITCKDYDSLCRALNEYSSTTRGISHCYPLLHINMPLLAASLYTLAERAIKNDIYVEFNIKNTHLESNAPEYQLSDFACIILQNAIEASKTGDYINAEISSQNGQFYLSVRNPVERFYENSELALFLKNGYTTKAHTQKQDNSPHGYGLYFVHKHIKKYNGNIGFECLQFENKYWIEFRIQV